MGKKSRSRHRHKPAPPPGPPGSAADPPPLSVLPGRERVALLVLLAAGLLLRAVYLLEYRSGSIFYGSLMLDAQVYDEWARRIVAGGWLGGPVFYHAPLYPYVLALFFRLLGVHYLPVYLFQLLTGTALLWLVARVGRRCASSWVGLAAGYLLLFYAPLPFFETKLMSTSLALFLSVAALWLLVEAWEGGGLARWSLAGVVIGLAALAHPASILLAPVFAVAQLIRTRRRGIAAAAVLACGTALAVAPATLHNLAAGGGFVPISSQGGITFLQGNTPTSRGLYRPVDGFSGSPLTQMEEEKRLAEKAEGRPLRASEVSSHWFGRGLEMIRARPGKFVDLLQLKFMRWLSSHEYSTEYSLYLEREESLALWIAFVPYGFLVAGAAAGAFLGRRTYGRLAPVYLYLLATVLPPMIFYVSSRYRIAAVPALAILSGTALERLAARGRAGGFLEAVPVAAVALFAGALTLIPYGRDHLFQEANVHYNVGNLYYDRGNYERAIREYQQALEVSDFEFYRINLGNAYARTGRPEEAIAQYRMVAGKKPRFAKAYLQWAKVLVEHGRKDEARDVYGKALALGARSPDVEAKLGAGPP